MDYRAAIVKIVDVTPTFISFQYLLTNARSRIKREDFLKDFQTGKILVENSQLLDK